jgi:sterol 3beta-glucosyltransferase
MTTFFFYSADSNHVPFFFSVHDRGLPRSSTMPGLIKNDEITNEPSGPSSLERSRTERRRQNNPADDPSKQLFDEKISIKKKVHVSRPLYLSVAS